MTPFDKQLLNVLQTKLPISKRPFADMAKILETDEEIVLERLKQLKEEGYLRRIGPFFDSEKLGYKGVLVAVKVKQDAMKDVAEFINRYPGATHNYEREGLYNLWFTLLTENEMQRDLILEKIKALPGVEDLINLVARKKYKINVQFDLK